MRVLLVEDHDDSREMFATYLSAHGITVDAAVTGLQAIDLALSRLPDVIVLDLELPGMDGWVAARHLRANPLTKDVPILAVSGHAFPRHRERAQDAGCDAFLIKPCLPTELLRAVLELRDRGRPEMLPGANEVLGPTDGDGEIGGDP
jgi:CheY-like chemotaxis protein